MIDSDGLMMSASRGLADILQCERFPSAKLTKRLVLLHSSTMGPRTAIHEDQLAKLRDPDHSPLPPGSRAAGSFPGASRTLFFLKGTSEWRHSLGHSLGSLVGSNCGATSSMDS